jgi:PAS domain S-box-containing protein
MAALLVVAASVAGWSIQREYSTQRDQAAQRLQAVSAFRANQVEGWVDRQMALAYFLDDSVLFADLFRRWKDEGDSDAGDALLTRVVELRRSLDSFDTLIVDPQGRALAEERPSGGSTDDPELRETVLNAIRSGESTHSPIYQGARNGVPVHMDVVIPLLKTGTPARGAIVLRIDPRRSLFPILRGVPAPGFNTESVLWRKTGDSVTNVSDTPDPGGGAGRISQPIADSTTALPRLLRGEVKAGDSVRGVDYRGAAVIGTVAPAPRAGLYLVSQTSIESIERAADSTAIWIATATAVLLGIVGVASRWLMQRHARARERREHEAQRQRVEALSLLQSITSSSTDAIFAKDLDGRFIFCNGAAGVALDISPDDAIGCMNQDVFSTATAARRTAEDERAMAGQATPSFERLQTPRGERWVLTTKSPLRDLDGRLIGMLGVMRDVTEVPEIRRSLHGAEDAEHSGSA